MEETHVVTVFLRNGTDVLLLRRSEDVGSYRGLWGAVAGHAEGSPDDRALEEIREETAIDPADLTLARAGDAFAVEDDERGTRWIVHPYLFDCPVREVEPNYETTDYEWCPPTALLERETVPDLWTSYERVAPTVETVREDEAHGSAYISVRALEVLRDRAAAGAEPDELSALARELRDARSGMAAVRNRVDRVMATAADADHSPDAVADAAADVIDAALDADAAAAENAAERAADERVVTLSHSGTALDALTGGDPAAVVVAESRPAREGVETAEALADAGVGVSLTTDAALPEAIDGADLVLVGADTVLPDGGVVNKVGTRVAALAAEATDCPFLAVCARDKVSTDLDPHLEAGDPADVYDGDADVAVANPLFDVTPPELVDGVVTEAGLLDADDVDALVEEFRDLADWDA